MKIFVCIGLALLLCLSQVNGIDIEGVIVAPIGAHSSWAAETKVLVDGNRYLGFVKSDGSFIVSDVAPGSYLVEFTNPTYLFQPVRVDINSKGKIRARSVNVLRTTAVKAVSHPLRVTTVGKAMYFQPREQLRTLDLLLNPTVLVMLVPLILVMLLPKLMDTNDPEFKELQKHGILSGAVARGAADVPELSDYLSSMSLLGGGGASSKKSGAKKSAAGATSGGSASAAQASSSTSSSSAGPEASSSRKSGNARKRN